LGAVLDELQVGDPRQVGNYTLLACLGSGGMGQVYFGRSPAGRHVAVKIIRADLAQDQSFRARFAREVEAALRVSGAFTAPVIDADPDAPIPWLVTDYVHGPSLGDAVAKHGPLPLPAVLALAARLAEGLSAVHAAGVIHRDLKPGNVLLAEDGPRLIDFGISQAADFAQITSPTTVLGTPGFIAPEVVQGESVGPSSDIFTMGAVLAYAATGELAFGAGPADARTLRVLYLAPDLSHVPAALRPLLERCLAKEPADRPTAGEFLADLVAACPDAAADRDEWLPQDVLAEIRQRPLREDTAYHFSTVAITSGHHSAPSAPYNAIDGHISPQVALGLADAAFDWVNSVEYKETYSSDTYWVEHVGNTWQDPWSVSTVCDAQACDATLEGSIDGISFTAPLHRFGATYTGSAQINKFFSCSSTTNYEKSTLNIRLTVTNATKTAQQWYVTSFKGTLTWNVPYDPNPGCDASLYQMTVHSL